MTNSITLIGRPVSVNHLWKTASGNGRPYTYLTDEGRAIKESWQWQAAMQMRKSGATLIEKDNVSISIHYFFQTKSRRDIDNYLKVILDCLAGIAYADDKQIHCLKAVKSYDAKNPRIEIIIKA